MKNLLRNEKGSMTVLVTVVILSFVIILLSVFAIANSIRKNQLRTELKIKEVYEQDVILRDTIKADGSYNEEKGVNTPNLGEGMIPIKWDENLNSGNGNWVITTAEDSEWYDYNEKQWANVMLSDGTYATKDLIESGEASGKQEAISGTEVSQSDLGSMFVWIPRFAYSITNGYHKSGADLNKAVPSQGAGTIEVEFMRGLANETSTGRREFDNATGEGNWNIHPAFEYGETIAGIWVAKFEASHSDAQAGIMGSSQTIKIVPSVSSWKNLSVGTAYSNCINYNKALNSHLIKNSEWGAIAYLSKSKYGKETEEIYINNSSRGITGASGSSSVANTNVSVNEDYTSFQGVKASTTGNVYGIYDMNGGAWEYVAAYLGDNSLTLNAAGDMLTSSDVRTKEIYVSVGSAREEEYEANNEKYGDAIYEISKVANAKNGSWYSDYSTFVNRGASIFLRGGMYSDGQNAGIFAFNSYVIGLLQTNNSFRPVLIKM